MGSILLSNEEIDAATKIAQLGYVSIYHPAATVMHYISRERVNQSWLRRRAFWQAVSDILMGNDLAKVDVTEAIRVFGDFSQLNPKTSQVSCLISEVSSAEALRKQIEAIHALVLLLASRHQQSASLPVEKE
jgi:hypothetical protein